MICEKTTRFVAVAVCQRAHQEAEFGEKQKLISNKLTTLILIINRSPRMTTIMFNEIRC
jgi:hypothetical protein